MENTEVFLLRLRGLVPTLNPKLRKIAEYILAHPDDIKFHRIGELASACGVADSTVTRFVKAVNLRTFQEFKILMAGIAAPGDVEQESGYRLIPVEVDGARLVREIYGEEQRP